MTKESVNFIVVALRLSCAVAFTIGAVMLASEGRDGWGWCIAAALLLGMVTIEGKVSE